MIGLHSLLARQLRRLQLDSEHAPGLEHWEQLLERVSRAYAEADQDRYTLQRSIEVSGGEMRELYAELARKHEALLENRQRTQAIFEHSAVGQAAIDEQGCCTEANTALAVMLQLERTDLVGSKLLDLIAPTSRTAFAVPLRELLLGKRRELAVEHQWQTNAGVAPWVYVTLSLVESSAGQPRFASLFVQDITARKRLEVELRHAQKLESVGRLAAGVAHEINTPVQFVSDNLPFLEEAVEAGRRLRARFRELLDRAVAADSVKLDEVTAAERDTEIEYFDEEVPRALAQTRDGVQRVATIVRAMKEFAHTDGGGRRRADLNHALASTITVARNEFKYVAEVQTEFGDIPEVSCNLGDLNQAFLNVLVNAAHAIADVVGSSGQLGLIRVRTALDEGSVVITISDSGAGIPDELHAHIFEPFFTTKEVGRGTGQGLAIARSVVVDRHAGQLTFHSRLGEGTTFEIRLPVDASELRLSRERLTAA